MENKIGGKDGHFHAQFLTVSCPEKTDRFTWNTWNATSGSWVSAGTVTIDCVVH